MKYLQSYTDKGISAAYKKAGAFFAFGNQQFNEQRVEGVEYVSLGGGTVCPKDTAKQFIEDITNVGEAGIAADLAENGKKAIIHRELANHEFCITYDIEQTSSALSGYGITDEEIKAETGEYLRKHYEWEEAQEV